MHTAQLQSGGDENVNKCFFTLDSPFDYADHVHAGGCAGNEGLAGGYMAGPAVLISYL